MLEAKEKSDDISHAAKGIIDRAGDQARTATQAAANKAHEDASGVIAAVKEKVHDVTAGASELVGKATDKAQEWASSVGDAAVHAKDMAMECASATAEKASDFGKEVTTLIRRYPIPALLIGLGTGFLIGQVFHHSSSRRA